MSSTDSAEGPGKEIAAQPGDCITSIAAASGHFWETIWNHPANVELRAARKNPNVLQPGDRIHIPPLRPREVACSTGQLHSFVLRGVPVKLSVRLLDENDEPFANEPCRVEVDGAATDMVLDANGRLEMPIPPTASRAVVTLKRAKHTVELMLGGVDPIESLSGIQERLENLGYRIDDPRGAAGESTRRALEEFQDRYGLTPTGEPDNATRSKLAEFHES
jgi:N-acetylmuramoyl-L-alanine amidase